MEKRVSQDTKAVTRLRKEQDELLQTMGRPCLERGMARKERDQVI